MKVIINKKINLEELFENKGKSWEDTMNFLKQVNYKNDFSKCFEGTINENLNLVEIVYDKFYFVDKSIFEIIEEPKEELEEIELLNTPYTKSQNDFAVENKINELIENQNKIIKQLKANNKQ